MKIIESKSAPAAVGPYSQAVESKTMLFISGQIGIIPETGKMAGESIEVQTKQVLKNLNAIIEEAGHSKNDVAKCTIYITDMSKFSEVNKIYADYFSEHKPARATVEVSALPLGAKVEIDAIAIAESRKEGFI